MKNFADLIKESFEIYKQKIASILILILRLNIKNNLFFLGLY